MKTRFIFSSALLLSLLLCACGKKDAPPPSPAPAGSPDASGATAPMPETAGPADLPPCPGFLSLESAKGDSRAGSSILISSQAADSLLDSYVADLSANGWTMTTSLQQGRDHHLLFRQGDRFLRFQIGPSDSPNGTTRLQLAWGQTAGAAEVREAHDPEVEEAPSAAAEGSREW